MKSRFLGTLVVLCVATIASAQVATPASKLAWDEVGQSVAVAQGSTYHLYVDGSPTSMPLTGVTCAAAGGTTTTCTAAFPALTLGTHTVTLTQMQAGAESPKSAALSFTFAVTVTPTNVRIVSS